MPATTRTVAAPITISIVPEPPGTAGAVCAGGLAVCQPNNCCGVSPCRRATAVTFSPSAQLSATIRAFCSAVHARRRPVPVSASSRCTGSGLDLCKSSVSDTCLARVIQHADIRASRLARQRGRKTPLTLVLDGPVNGLSFKAKTLTRWPGVTSDVSGNNAVAMEMNIQPDEKAAFTGDYVGFGAILGLVIIRLAQHVSAAKQL
jgi:hypothetical protein